ncbi:hypothetical protein, partial [Clostridium perfringens]|uniref:hypothetical protein n=1 Tax=Clostridium perfringens TaxID=1502 RepID=UPI003754A3A7
LAADTLAVDRLAARLAVTRADSAAWRLHGDGTISAVTTGGMELPAGFGSKLGWTLAATGDPNARTLAVDRFAVSSAGLDAEASGVLGPAEGKLALKAVMADLAGLKSLAGLPGLLGRVDLTADLSFDADRRLTTTVDAKVDGIATGI